MAGHSKWANIKHRKGREDAKRGKIFSKYSKKITLAAKNGGGDPEMNPELRMLIQKAKENNMPNDNIDRAIKKGTGELEGVSYEEIIYEGYGPCGTALYLELMTDNRNRTAADIRHLLSKHGGNLGESGCVAWMFERRGTLIIDSSEQEFDADELMMAALEAGAEDIQVEDGVATVYTDPSEWMAVQENLTEAGYKISDSNVAMIPNNEVAIATVEDAKKVLKLMDILEDHDDVQEVYSNFDIPADLMEQIED